MGVRSALAAWAGRPVPTFVIAGCGGRPAADDLYLDERLLLLHSPRAAGVLLITGTLTERLLPAALLVHDQMARPRAVVQWLPGGGEDPLLGAFPAPIVVAADGDPAQAASRALREVLTGNRPSSPPIYPDVAPAPWRGVGPYGQGGKGMSGGVPYGRPLAGRAADRDGLELDQLPLQIGPIFPPFPPGLIVSIHLQGDVVQEVAGWENALAGGPSPEKDDPFHRALREPVTVAELEVARARHHLRWLCRTLRLHGLGGVGLRVLALARRVGSGDAQAVAALRRRLERSRSLAWATAGMGVVPPGALGEGAGGPVARASAITVDARGEDPLYRRLGFEPVTHHEGDARARWRQRLAETAQALDLAERADDRTIEPSALVESPRGELRLQSSPSQELLRLLPPLLAGREWGEAVALVHDLDLDMEEAAVAAAREVA
jgi:hypothetical protein